MSTVGQLSAKGQLIRQLLLQPDEHLKNREIAERVIQHFPNEVFDRKKLTQLIANLRYSASRRNRVSTENTNQNG